MRGILKQVQTKRKNKLIDYHALPVEPADSQQDAKGRGRSVRLGCC